MKDISIPATIPTIIFGIVKAPVIKPLNISASIAEPMPIPAILINEKTSPIIPRTSNSHNSAPRPCREMILPIMMIAIEAKLIHRLYS